MAAYGNGDMCTWARSIGTATGRCALGTSGSRNQEPARDEQQWHGDKHDRSGSLGWRNFTSNNQAFQPRRFTSYERDGNGGDEAMMRRYAGKWQRFVQPDPYDGSYNLANPQSFNRNTYVQNDPVNFVDPTGLTEEEWQKFNCSTRRDLEPGCSITHLVGKDHVMGARRVQEIQLVVREEEVAGGKPRSLIRVQL